MDAERACGSLTNGAYIEERVDDQIRWYEGKANRHKWLYFTARFIELAASAAIPFMVSLASEDFDPGYILSGLGLIVIITAGMLSLFKYQENWTNYRTTAETLKHEKFLYKTGTSPYDTRRRDPFELFVKRIESDISQEHSQWLSYVTKDSDGKGDDEQSTSEN